LGRRPLGAILHSSNEPGELSQWLCHDDSTINIVLVVIIIIIIIKTRMIGLLYGEKNYDNMLSRFHPIPERNGRTERQVCYINIARQYTDAR